jgi:N6-L-threonylcarbamoyladenine synthase
MFRPNRNSRLMALLVSGGHTELNLMTDHLTYQRLGSTLDDAAGEAFDKVARLLELPYPGGPSIQKTAEEGDPNRFNFPRAWLDGTWNFSFSGLKTSVLYETRELQKKSNSIPVPDLAASFQQAVIDVLFKKTMNAAREFGAKEILVAGGVSANRPIAAGVQVTDRVPCTYSSAFVMHRQRRHDRRGGILSLCAGTCLGFGY